ncbi:transcriptional regulator, TetR family [Desulfovibrio sp. X2]|uniref:TetR/AcrR family transcriptional regulator n=1 Tax=Desulfovibrio sp. X2 TaxID=941449 RepID=UPI000358F3A3|nr:TetR/AcrR family transcriptional regulator [Desulfovibrio sp. X2]EPR38727.1 transcriptional regulator, TetR family [Desulfovibrio sp. X2]
MDNAYKRKKQPQQVRAQVLQAAAEVIASRGLAGMTLDLVARKAGVSKGGLLHHFPSKQHLVDEIFDSERQAFADTCARLMADDPDPRGRFTRAYVQTIVFRLSKGIESEFLDACCLSMAGDKPLSSSWREWVLGQIVAHGESLDSVLGRMIRYAAEGVWLEDAMGVSSLTSEERRTLVDHLVRLSHDI